jgi:ATP-dependent protease Clp ATPase subunit
MIAVMAMDSWCSFCGKAPQQVRRVVRGRNARICNECLDLCRQIIVEEKQAGRRRKAEFECSFCGKAAAGWIT